ncbi:phosphoenolpyruvate synthase [Candidatus Uhrbacteria bacterium RIFCSPHIGHO2_12_FULL_54_23]|uniref:Phosphoenolpyruvate synthase n=3 Tax=Candidatus Uhriibacteriota TaxID=1752732 RepID=A0A1F7UGY6_9BACT|nr:MAG: phosphoenolpyruvate synthase [Candidatus Uhrbacteria bacterium RIFCSPHIGHO2_12_FULL_54_23]OGL85114.1 MAG: phosphoenolpyruvate synthase [Candidatus Uhrbacteria bacterium RIFCSPLOWO2_01_FULL_55_36]OGL91198.1 MAG: phosphoenolpyruvate synthase [Candidatus Uhrbacteria bacterium RIFCSPLOWO2_02_FULL_54_37]
MPSLSQFVIPFRQISLRDVPTVGGKNASLGEMVRTLGSRGVRVPDGFAVTSAAYRHCMKRAGLDTKVKTLLKGLDTHNMRALQRVGETIRQMIRAAPLPDEVRAAIIGSYRMLSRQEGTKSLSVAVRSSATAEDLPDASFAGQQETYLNVVGEAAVCEAVRKAYASLFTNRAISYRVDKGFAQRDVALSVGIQAMVRSDRGSSGVLFTIDTESGFRNVVLINAIWGLGENIVQGAVNPDEFIIFKPTLAQGKCAIIAKRLGTKHLKMVYAKKTQNSKLKTQNSGVPSARFAPTTVNVSLPLKDQLRFALTDEEALILARWGVIIERHYGKPMDIEWAKDGRTGKLYIVQARPETVMARKNVNILETYRLKNGAARKKHTVLVEGVAVGAKVGSGRVRVIRDASGIHTFQKGEVLVTTMTDPDWEPIMKIASAIVTDSGGRTAHAAIVSRELGIPAIVGTGNATTVLKNGQTVTVSCAEGERGVVYQGALPFVVERVNLKALTPPKTQMMMIVGEPEQAFSFAQIPNQGVGLARLEFIISNYVRIHPLALLNLSRLKDARARAAIARLTRAEPNKPKYFVDQLAYGIARIGAAFWPHDVIVRLSDFKSNEYASLIGGREYEPEERNPMIGWRGASRYYDPKYRAGFALECAALKKVREEMGLLNIKVMVPFCRTVEEGKRVIAEMKKNGLVRGKSGLEVYVMAEIPSNVILADKFSAIFDGFSIGSNDLAQLTLGLDRDSGLVASVGDERNLAVKRMMSMVIKTAKKYKRKIGICGQAPSDFPAIAEFLVKEGIDSISLQPDTVLKTTLQVLKVERRMKK